MGSAWSFSHGHRRCLAQGSPFIARFWRSFQTCWRRAYTIWKKKCSALAAPSTPSIPVYRCPANEKLSFRYTNIESGETLRRYWTNGCGNCALKELCTTGKQRLITRHEDEHVLEAVQQRLDANPQAMRQRRETVEHPFGTIKARMGATHFQMRTLPKVATEMALAVLA